MKAFALILAVSAVTLAGEELPKKWFGQPTLEFEAGNHGYTEGNFLLPIYPRWDFEGNTYRVEENLVGFGGFSHSIHIGKHFRLHPGVGVLFGFGEPTGGGLKLRSFLKTERWVSEASVIKGLRPSVEDHRDLFAEGHFSVRIPAWSDRSVELGVTGEDISYREGKEKLIGGRLLIPAGRHFGFTAKVMSHNTFRFGVLWLPSKE